MYIQIYLFLREQRMIVVMVCISETAFAKLTFQWNVKGCCFSFSNDYPKQQFTYTLNIANTKIKFIHREKTVRIFTFRVFFYGNIQSEKNIGSLPEKKMILNIFSKMFILNFIDGFWKKKHFLYFPHRTNTTRIWTIWTIFGKVK